jgi:DNA polymerase elongation subunit (family B)
VARSLKIHYIDEHPEGFKCEYCQKVYKPQSERFYLKHRETCSVKFCVENTIDMNELEILRKENEELKSEIAELYRQKDDITCKHCNSCTCELESISTSPSLSDEYNKIIKNMEPDHTQYEFEVPNGCSDIYWENKRIVFIKNGHKYVLDCDQVCYPIFDTFPEDNYGLYKQIKATAMRPLSELLNKGVKIKMDLLMCANDWKYSHDFDKLYFDIECVAQDDKFPGPENETTFVYSIQFDHNNVVHLYTLNAYGRRMNSFDERFENVRTRGFSDSSSLCMGFIEYLRKLDRYTVVCPYNGASSM